MHNCDPWFCVAHSPADWPYTPSSAGDFSHMLTKDFKIADRVTCPKCGAGMVLAAVTPHPINARMERHTYLCEPCNQTKTYALPAK
jgi:ribosomal protein S27AE